MTSQPCWPTQVPNAATFTPGSLTFTLTGNQDTDNTLLIQKSNGSDWLALWNETAAAHTVRLTLGSTASQILVFDPVKGTTAIATTGNTNTISVSLGGDPLLIEIIPSAGGGGSGSGTGSGGTSTGGSGSSGSSSGSGAGSSPNPVVTVPAKATVAANATVAVTGVSVTDAWASHNPGALTLNVTSVARHRRDARFQRQAADRFRNHRNPRQRNALTDQCRAEDAHLCRRRIRWRRHRHGRHLGPGRRGGDKDRRSDHQQRCCASRRNDAHSIEGHRHVRNRRDHRRLRHGPLGRQPTRLAHAERLRHRWHRV